MSAYRALPWHGFRNSLTTGESVFTTERLNHGQGHAIECKGPQPWRQERWQREIPFFPAGAQLMLLGPDRIGFCQNYMHSHEYRGRFFFDIFSTRGAHIATLGEINLGELVLGTDTLWIIRRVGGGEASGLSIEGVVLQTGDRSTPMTMTAQTIQMLGAPISQRAWLESYGSGRSFWGLNWQEDRPWLTVQVLRSSKRPIRKRYHLPLEAALIYLSQNDSMRTP